MTKAALEYAAEIISLRNVAAMRMAIAAIQDETTKQAVGMMIKRQLYTIKQHQYFYWYPLIKPEEIID